jgi:hypothetical protein
MLRNRRYLRRWATLVLLMWLFGLAMGVANACALGEPGREAHAAAASDHGHGERARVVDSIATIGDHHRADGNDANCLDYCEKLSIGAPKPKVADDGTAVVGLPIPVSARPGVIELPEPDAGHLRRSSTHLRGAPPLRTALQRLAL